MDTLEKRCRDCDAKCCSGVLVTLEELVKIKQYVDVSEEVLMESFLQKSTGGWLTSSNSDIPCSFLGIVDDSFLGCTIHEVKPLQCSAFDIACCDNFISLLERKEKV